MMTTKSLTRSLRLRSGQALVLCAAAGVLVLLARPALSQQDDQDVMKVIPENYKLLFENTFVRVIEARVPPGTEEKPHRHMRGVSICMTDTPSSRAFCPTASGCAPTASTALSTGASRACTSSATWARRRATRFAWS